MTPIRRRGAAPWLAALALGLAATTSQAQNLHRDGFEDSGTRPETAADASRFLQQATFGATEPDIATLQGSTYAAWIDAQLALPPSLMLPYMRTAAGVSNPAAPIDFRYLTEAWFDRTLTAPDQLRQRVAFALSQIMVVSERSANLANDGLTLGAYYDILLQHGLGNYRELLEQVTLSPAMGRFLSMYRNRKPDPVSNSRPDENFAREVQQLFSLGLVELNRDGSPRLVNDQTVPTYDESVVRGFAHVFTGWACPLFPFEDAQGTCTTALPMRAFEDYHDRGEKRLFRDIVLPAGRDARVDLEDALDAIFEHPNVAPFISRQLIQKLVTSNPTPQYVERIATVFEDDGRGERGNLGAVVRAILLDPEARFGHQQLPQTFGKVREPLLRLTQVWRGLEVSWERNELFPDDRDIHVTYNQTPLGAPSVFNFFSPSYSPGGALAPRRMVAPELQSITDAFAIALSNDLWGRIHWQCHGCRMSAQNFPGVRETHLDNWQAMIADRRDASVDALIERANVLFLGGTLSPALRAQIRARVLAVSPDAEADQPLPLLRVHNALYLITASAEFAVQR